MDKRERTGALYVLTAGILWGSMGLFVRYFSSLGLSSLQIVAVRNLITLAVLALLIAVKDPRLFRIKLKDIWCVLGTGLVSILFFTYCYYQTIQAASMAVAATLLYTSPVFVMLFSLLLFKEKLTWRKGAACLASIAGCALVSGITGAEPMGLTALLTGLGAGFGYAMYSIFGRYALDRGYDPLTVTFYTFAFSGLGVCLLTDVPQVPQLLSSGSVPANIAMGLGLSVFVTVVPYLMYTAGLTRLSAGKAAVLAAVEPVAAAVLGFLIMQEMPGWQSTAGILLVLLAIVILNAGRTKRA